MEWIRRLGQIHGKYPACVYGEYRELLLTNRQYVFARILGDQAVVAAVNNDENPASVTFALPVGGKEYLDEVSGEKYSDDQGLVTIELKKYGCAVLCTPAQEV